MAGLTEVEVEAEAEVLANTKEPDWQYFRFSLASLMMVIAGLGLLFALWSFSPEVCIMTLAGAAVANVLGAIFGWTVTNILGFPNDGSLRSQKSAAEKEVNDANVE